MGAVDSIRRSGLGLTAAIFGLCVLIAAALTWPLLAEIRTAIPHDPGDPALNTWILWWNAVSVPFTSAWWNAPAFFPTQGALTFSEHLLGLWPISTPIYWLTGNIQLGYNVALFLSFPLSAFFTYLLARDLTGRRDAAFIAGLIFGFAPYRIVQLPHIQVLCSYWMPLALLGLHRYLREPRRRWLLLFGVAWLMQALSNGYYLVFLSVLIACWIAWYVTARRWRLVFHIAVAWGLAALPLLPIVFAYRRVHAGLGLRRSINEMLLYSADLTSLIDHSPRLLFWQWLPAWHRPEGELFPGIAAIVMIVCGLGIWSTRGGSADARPRRHVRLAMAVLALMAMGAALASLIHPFEVSLAGATISVTHFHKPLTAALLALMGLVVTSPRVIHAWRQRSAFAFYGFTAVLMWFFSLGPKPTLFGVQALYQGPYAWLLYLPGLDTLRTPARFHMATVLCLACAAAIGFARWGSTLRGGRRLAAGAAMSLVALADTWIAPFPMAPAPPPWNVERQAVPGALVEIPLGTVAGDAGAMYRSIRTGHAVVNGYSGHRPPAYRAVELGLSQQDPELLAELSRRGVTQLAIDLSADDAPAWRSYLERRAEFQLIGDDGEHRLYRLPAVLPWQSPRFGTAVRIASVTASPSASDAAKMTDGDLMTWWETAAQRGTEVVLIDLGEPRRIRGLVLALGPRANDIPRELEVEGSDDQQTWMPFWHGSSAAPAFRAALEDPVRIPLTFDLGDRVTRFIRIRQLGQELIYHWSIAELQVLAPVER